MTSLTRSLLYLSAIVFLVCVLLLTITQPALAQSAQERLCDGAGGNFENGKCVDPNGGNNLFNATDSTPSIFQRIADTLLFITGAISVIMLIIGGIRYVVSQGDQNAVTAAKNTILYAIIGLIITFLAFAAVRFVIDQLEGTDEDSVSLVQQIDMFA